LHFDADRRKHLLALGWIGVQNTEHSRETIMNHGIRLDAGRWTAALLISTLVFVASPLRAQTYSVTDLGTGDGNDSYGSGINNSGKVAGYWYLVGYPYYYDNSTPVQAAVWDRTTLVNLDPLPGHTHTFASAINNQSQVAGESCEIDSVDCHHVIWNGVTPTDLGASGGAALAINDSAQLAGFISGTSPMVQRAAVWTNGHATTLPTLPGEANSAALGINNSGQIAGVIYVDTGSDVVQHAVVWKGETITDLGLNSVANAINAKGEVVGYLIDSNHAFFHATLWKDGSTTDLGTLGGTDSQANAINSSGQIVGWSMTATGLEDATLWANGQTIDLNSKLSPALSSIFSLTSANAINDSGQIVTTAYDTQTSQIHIFLLSPLGCSDSDSNRDSHEHHRNRDHKGDDRHQDRDDDDRGCCREHHRNDGREDKHCGEHRD
jgi:probable HAF family extracellular repeat protein